MLRVAHAARLAPATTAIHAHWIPVPRAPARMSSRMPTGMGSDAHDQCPNPPVGEPVDANGCTCSQRDSDGDGVNDCDDQCPDTPVGESGKNQRGFYLHNVVPT